jgi:RNA polymerase sigma factor (sigma-70 family)
MKPSFGTVPLEDPSADLAWTRRVALRLVRDEAASDDISQDAWLITRRARPNPERSLRPWLGQVVLNLVRRRHRASKRRNRWELAAEAPEPTLSADQLLERAQIQRLLVGLVDELAEPSRQIVRLHYFEGLTSDEIGRRLQLAAGTVRWRLSRTIEELREKLDREHGGERRRWVTSFLPLFAPAARPAAKPPTGSLAPRWAVSRLSSAGRTWLIAVPLGGLLLGCIALWLGRAPHEPLDPRDPAATATLAHGAASAVPVGRAPGPGLRLAPTLAGARVPGPEETGTLEGVVIDPEGRGLPGAVVALFSENPNNGGWPRPIRTEVTGPDGHFLLAAVSPGKYVLSAHRNGFFFVHDRELSLAAGESRTGLEVRLARGGHQIRGRVTDSGGGWIVGARVTANTMMDWRRDGRGRGVPFSFAVTDSGGEFQITVPTPIADLQVVADGYMRGVAFPRNTHEVVNVRLEPGAELAGRVVHRSTGEPVPGARVVLLSENRERRPGPAIRSDDGGRFVLGPVAAGLYHLQASAGALIGRTAGPVAVTVPPAGEVILEVDRGLVVRGRVVGSGGRPLANVDMSLSTGRANLGGVNDGILARTGPDGRYLIEGLLPGERFVTARAPDRELVHAVKRILIQDPLTTVDFVVERGVAVEGRVLDCRGAGVRGAQVEIRPEPSVMTWPVDTISGPAGVFRMVGLPRANGRLTFEHGQHGDPVTQTIAVGEGIANLELRLPCPP